MPVTITTPPTVTVTTAGTQGPRGNTILRGTGAPAAGVGIDGDWYIDNTTPSALTIYGPKTAGAWGSGQPIGGSGGGGTVRDKTAKVRITNDNLSGLPSTASWAVVVTSAATPLRCSIAAVAGDRIEVYGNFMYAGAHYLDWVLLSSGGAIAAYAAADPNTPGTPLGEGNPTMYPSTSFSRMTTTDVFTVGSGNIDGSGNITIGLAHQGTSAGTVYAHPLYPWRLRLKNIGAEPA